VLIDILSETMQPCADGRRAPLVDGSHVDIDGVTTRFTRVSGRLQSPVTRWGFSSTTGYCGSVRVGTLYCYSYSNWDYFYSAQ